MTGIFSTSNFVFIFMNYSINCNNPHAIVYLVFVMIRGFLVSDSEAYPENTHVLSETVRAVLLQTMSEIFKSS